MPVSPNSLRQSVEFNPRLLEQLACPVCFGPLELASSRTKIGCVECGRIYPLVDDIPILISERAG